MKIILLLAIVLLTAGCATPVALHQDKSYPASWLRYVPPAAGIQAIDGSYENVAEITEGTKVHVRLTDLFPPKLRVEPKDAKVVTLKLVAGEKQRNGDTPAKLQITLPGEVIYHYECDCVIFSGNLFLPQDQGAAVLGPAVMLISESRASMECTADGSLVVKLDDVTAGEILLVPYGSHHTAWVRFRRVAEQPPATTGRPDKGDHP